MLFHAGMPNFSKLDDRCTDHPSPKPATFIETRRNSSLGYRKELHDGGDVGL